MRVKKIKNKLPLKRKSLLHVDFFGFFNLVGIENNTKNLEKFFFDYVENNFCKKFILPTFNYQFCKKLQTKDNSKSEINSISEYFRKNVSKWRSLDPIFSFCGNYKKKKLIFKNKLRSFDKNSSIHEIIKSDGYYFFCGTPISFISPGIHYFENLISTRYRYDKIFIGRFKIKGRYKKMKYIYKVWPKIKNSFKNEILMNTRYDAKKINKDLINNGIMKVIKKNSKNYIMYCKAREFNNFLKKKIKEDELYPLDRGTKSWIRPMLKRLKRPFALSDFE